MFTRDCRLSISSTGERARGTLTPEPFPSFVGNRRSPRSEGSAWWASAPAPQMASTSTSTLRQVQFLRIRLNSPRTSILAVGTSPGFISHRSKLTHAQTLSCPCLSSLPSSTRFAMHPRAVGNGRVNVSRSYQPSTPMPDRWNSDNFRSVSGNPVKVRPLGPGPETFGPQELVKTNRQSMPVSALPQARPPPQTRLPLSPSKSVPALVPRIPVDAATKLPPMTTPSFPITQQPPVPGPFLGPSTLNNLRSPKSVPALAGAYHWTSRGEQELTEYP